MPADVLIVGGGPVGLALANVLGTRGVEVTVVERDPGVAQEPRAVSIDDEAMRLMQSLDLYDEVREISISSTGTLYYGADGKPLAYARGAEHPLHGQPVKNLLDHSEFQQILLDGLARFPSVTVKHRTMVTALSLKEDRIVATLEAEEGMLEKVEAAYAVGCDGGRSTVRKELGVKMLGSRSPERWLVIDTINDAHRERYAMHHGDPTRPHVIIIGRGGRCRYEFLLNDGEGDDPAGLQELATRCIAPYRALPPDDVVRCTVYTFNSLVAASWRQGRAFVAGDAAHMMPPFAGQGLNSGLRDVFNLGWKLGLALADGGSRELLDSYEIERRPHVEAMLRLSVRMGKVVMTRSRGRARIRDLALRAGQKVPTIKRFLAEMRFKPAAEYPDGLQIPGSRPGPPLGAMLAQPRVYLADAGYSQLDDLLGPGFALLALDVPTAGLASIDSPLWDRLGAARFSLSLGDTVPTDEAGWRGIADETGALRRQLGGLGGRILVVRPDRFVLGSFVPEEEDHFATLVGHVCGIAGPPAGPAAPVPDPAAPVPVPGPALEVKPAE